MYAPQRQDAITEEIIARGGMSVTELADLHAVSSETIRRDLDALERQRRITRVHGGAVPHRAHSGEENSVSVRSTTSLDAKKRIARAAADHLPATGGSVLVDSGTTTALLSDGLMDRTDLTVVTNSVLLSHQLAAHPPGGVDHRIRIVGGQVRSITQSVVGAETVDTLRTMQADVAFLGTNGITAEFGFSTPDPAEAQTKAAMARAARIRVVLADQTKLGEELLCSFASATDIDLLITDAPTSDPILRELRHQGMDVIQA
jgi:DeoR family fructose operon transcriptional repressor